MNVKHHESERDDHHEIRGRRDTTAERHLAAVQATQLAREQYAIRISKEGQQAADTSWRNTASVIYCFLVGPVRLHISRGPVRDQNTGDVIRHHHEGEHKMAVVLTDTQKVDLAVAETDAKGNPTTADQINWTLDNTAIGSLTVSADTMTCTFVASGVGTGNITATDANDANVSGVEAVQVTGGPATAIVISAGTPTAQ